MRILPKIKSQPEGAQSKYMLTNRLDKHTSSEFLTKVSLVAIVALSIIFTLIVSLSGVKMAILGIVVILAVPLVVAIIAYPKVGIITLLIAAYFIMWIIRMGVDFPLGTLMDGTQALLILGFFLKQKYYPDWSIFKTPVAIVVLVWVGYNILEVANPTAESRLAWVYTVRSMAIVTLMYFIFSYHIKTLSFIRLLFNIWMVLSFLGALNAFKQEHFGFFAFEEANFNDPLIISLLFINGTWRKFSIFNDPVVFSYNMAISTIYCLCVIISPGSRIRKIIHGLLAAFCTITMLYSATRASYILLPAAAALYVAMNMNKKVLIMAIIGAVGFLALINVPTSNVTLYRFQSAFKPSDDASYNVRKANQKRIQPYIQTHPMGGGLGATGAWGVRFAPHSFLAQLPPDSGYIRVAVELGWIGLFLFCCLFFVSLRQGIINYYLIKDLELKNYCLAMTLIVFALNIGSFPQEAIVQFPTNIYFYFFLAMINVTLKVDQAKLQLSS